MPIPRLRYAAMAASLVLAPFAGHTAAHAGPVRLTASPCRSDIATAQVDLVAADAADTAGDAATALAADTKVSADLNAAAADCANQPTPIPQEITVAQSLNATVTASDRIGNTGAARRTRSILNSFVNDIFER
ncbi:hypothetical protein ACH4FE_19875 [Streptomyces celluloflavus]|uniref:hypothetical protein n=1 Tax=Streptomyces celluloflavus TaxID=58344 RepID=UPI0037ACA37A